MPEPGATDREIVSIDVSELEPPEPMERIFATLRQLQDRQLLRVRHRREPFPIYPMLAQGGYEHCCIEVGSESYLIYIWPVSADVDEAFCRADAMTDSQ